MNEYTSYSQSPCLCNVVIKQLDLKRTAISGSYFNPVDYCDNY